MARTDPQVNIRMQAELKARLEAGAAMSGRSLNSEIIERLNSTFSINPERALKTIESQTALVGLMGRQLAMMAELAKKGNPDKLEQILLIETLAQTLSQGDYHSALEVTGDMRQLSANKAGQRKETPANSRIPSKKTPKT